MLTCYAQKFKPKYHFRGKNIIEMNLVFGEPKGILKNLKII